MTTTDVTPPNGQTYTLETLSDFWAIGDADRMERAFNEISFGMVQAMRMQALLKCIAGELCDDGEPAQVVLTLPPAIEWVDDGLGNVSIGVKTGHNGPADVTFNYEGRKP